MTTSMLDLKASTSDARMIRDFARDQAIAALKNCTQVDHDVLDEFSQNFSTSLLWSRITFDRPWFDAAADLLRADELKSWLELEASMQPSFQYHKSNTLLTHWNWQLPQDFVAVNLEVSQGKIMAALALISRIWPDALTDIQAFNHAVLWFQSRNFYNFSDVRYFGSIFLRPDVLEKSILEIATLLIHETAHHVLFVEFLRDPLILDDPSRTVYSPLRRTQRPIHGTYQSLAALVRMIIWLHQTLDYAGPLDQELRDEAERSCDRYQNDLRLLVESMRAIRYTARGQQIFDDFVFVQDHL